MKQVKPRIQDLGTANGWKEKPAILKVCWSAGHLQYETDISRFRTEVRCDICGYRYEYDSS